MGRPKKEQKTEEELKEESLATKREEKDKEEHSSLEEAKRTSDKKIENTRSPNDPIDDAKGEYHQEIAEKPTPGSKGDKEEK